MKIFLGLLIIYCILLVSCTGSVSPEDAPGKPEEVTAEPAETAALDQVKEFDEWRRVFAEILNEGVLQTKVKP